jgi:hypothetical protein
MDKVVWSRRRNLGPQDPETLTGWHDLGMAAAAVRDAAGELSSFTEAYDGRRLALGPSHADTLASLVELTRSHLYGNPLELRRFCAPKLEELESDPGRSHPVTLKIACALGKSMSEPPFASYQSAVIDRRARGLDLIEMASLGLAKALGEDHPEALDAALEFGKAMLTSKMLPEAQVVLDKAIVGYNRSCGSLSPYTARATQALADCLKAMGDSDTANLIMGRVLGIWRKLSTPSHFCMPQGAWMLALSQGISFLTALKDDYVSAADYLREKGESGSPGSVYPAIKRDILELDKVIRSRSPSSGYVLRRLR